MTDPFYRQDIFFYVTTIAVVVMGLLASILIAYFISIFRDIKYITKKARQQSDLIADDINSLREDIKSQGFKWSFLGNFFQKVYQKRNKK
jgi:hypothetical protein